MAYAHSPNPEGDWHDLVAHLRGTSELASTFAAAFGAAEAARIVGLWHDLGKFHPNFQQYLRDSTADPSRRGHGPDHKAAGSQLAREYLGPLAYLIKGHHGGLDSSTGFASWLAQRQQARGYRGVARAGAGGAARGGDAAEGRAAFAVHGRCTCGRVLSPHAPRTRCSHRVRIETTQTSSCAARWARIRGWTACGACHACRRGAGWRRVGRIAMDWDEGLTALVCRCARVRG